MIRIMLEVNEVIYLSVGGNEVEVKILLDGIECNNYVVDGEKEEIENWIKDNCEIYL